MTDVDEKNMWVKKNDWCYHCGKRFEKVVEMSSNYKNIDEPAPDGENLTRLCEECLREALDILNNEG